MKCKTIHKKLIFFLENELNQKEMKEVADHLYGCHACEEYAGYLKGTLDVIQIEKRVEVSPYFYSRLKNRMIKQEDVDMPKSVFWVREKVLQPVMFSLLLMAGVYAGILIGQPSETSIRDNYLVNTEVIPFLNEMDAEPIENFLME
jgi:hypothetical protein